MLYVGSCDGSFYALNRHDGRLAWSYDTTRDGDIGNFHGTPVISSKSIVIGTDTISEGNIYAFDPATGEVHWQHATPGGFPSDLASLGSRALAVTMSGEVWSLDLETGRVEWQTDGIDDERLLRSSVMVAGDRAIVSLPSGEVFAVAANTGERIWSTSFDEPLNTSLAIIDASVYIGDLSGRIHRMSLESGEKLGMFEAESPAYGSLTRAGDCLLALWAEDTLACLDASLGRVQWRQMVDTTWSSFRPLVHGNVVIAGTEDGDVMAFDLSDGSLVWKHRFEGQIKGLSASGDVVYVGTLQGRVYALRLAPPGQR